MCKDKAHSRIGQVTSGSGFMAGPGILRAEGRHEPLPLTPTKILNSFSLCIIDLLKSKCFHVFQLFHPMRRCHYFGLSGS